MEELGKILNFIHVHFFYDLRSSFISLSVLFLSLFMYKLLKYKGDKPLKSLYYIVGTVVPFVVLMILI